MQSATWAKQTIQLVTSGRTWLCFPYSPDKFGPGRFRERYLASILYHCILYHCRQNICFRGFKNEKHCECVTMETSQHHIFPIYSISFLLFLFRLKKEENQAGLFCSKYLYGCTVKYIKQYFCTILQIMLRLGHHIGSFCIDWNVFAIFLLNLNNLSITYLLSITQYYLFPLKWIGKGVLETPK